MSDEQIVPFRFSQETLDKMSREEQRQVQARLARWDQSFHNLQMDMPLRLLMQVPVAADSTAEIRVTRWPKSVAEFDTLLSAIKAARSAFLKSRTR